MHQRKSKKILVYFFILIIVSSISNNSLNNFKLNKTQRINVSGLNESNNQKLLKEIKKISLENIFLMNKREIIKILNSNSLIERYQVFKKYPSTINIEVQKTNFYAKLNNKGKTFLVGSNGKLTLSKSDYTDLPFIFGKPSTTEFLKLKKIIDKSKFSYEQIKDFYFFPSNRWDLKFKDGILLKLPNNVSYETLDYLYEFMENLDVDNFNIVDARVKKQIILNE